MHGISIDILCRRTMHLVWWVFLFFFFFYIGPCRNMLDHISPPTKSRTNTSISERHHQLSVQSELTCRLQRLYMYTYTYIHIQNGALGMSTMPWASFKLYRRCTMLCGFSCAYYTLFLSQFSLSFSLAYNRCQRFKDATRYECRR